MFFSRAKGKQAQTVIQCTHARDNILVVEAQKDLFRNFGLLAFVNRCHRMKHFF